MKIGIAFLRKVLVFYILVQPLMVYANFFVYLALRDMFIFDDPLRYIADESESAILFKNVSDYLIQAGRTIMITTTNEEVRTHPFGTSLEIN